MKKNILVLSENYPDNNGNIDMQYVHTRNLYYQKENIKVDVLSFRANENYTIDGISVLSSRNFNGKSIDKYDVILSHAPNLRNHLKTLIKVRDKSKIILFFHGHEVMNISKHYPKPFVFSHKGKSHTSLISKVYDFFKLKFWKYSPKTIFKNSTFIFVSEWMLQTFKEDTGIKNMNNKCFIIPNAIGEYFIENSINKNAIKNKDVVTIRPFYDHSKYGIDLVSHHAKNNPHLKFHVYGKGEYFDYYDKPNNLILHNKYLNHKEIGNILDSTKLVYLPTRLDAQGVLACEIATYGAKMLTSDIPIMREMLHDFENVEFITNEFENYNFIDYFNDNNQKSNNKFNYKSTIKEEIDLIISIN